MLPLHNYQNRRNDGAYVVLSYSLTYAFVNALFEIVNLNAFVPLPTSVRVVPSLPKFRTAPFVSAARSPAVIAIDAVRP